MSCARRRSRSGYWATRASSSATRSEWRPSSSSASIRSSIAADRSSSSLAASARANGMSAQSASAGPRHRAEIGPGFLDGALEPVRVQLVGLDDHQVTRASGDQHIRLDQLAQLRDAVLDHLRGCRRRLALPELVDQAVAGDDLVRPQQENGHQLALAASPQRDQPISRADLEGTKDAVVHLAPWREITQRLPADGGARRT